MSFWTDERVALLKRLWTVEGLSAREIAERFGCPRSAVSGKVFRLGLTGQGGSQPARGGRSRKRLKTKPVLAIVPQVAPDRTPAKPQPAGLTSEQRAMQARKDNAAREAAAVRAAIAAGAEARASGVLLSEAKDRHCRWPVGGELAELVVCGANAKPGRPYCEEHCVRSVTPGTYPSKAEHALVWYADKCGRAPPPNPEPPVKPLTLDPVARVPRKAVGGRG